MKTSSGLIGAVLASSLSIAPAHAEESTAAASQEDYDRHFIGFDDWSVLDLHSRSVYRVSEPYEGKDRVPLAPTDFYRKVGREDLAQEYELRENRRSALMATGTAIAVGGLTAMAVIAIAGQPGGCSQQSFADFSSCVSDQGAQARDTMITAGLVGLGGAVIGGLFCLAGSGIDPNPVGPAVMHDLAERHNQDLKRRLGLSVAPVAAPGRAGLALDLRF